MNDTELREILLFEGALARLRPEVDAAALGRKQLGDPVDLPPRMQQRSRRLGPH
jgi:hypothetical protein